MYQISDFYADCTSQDVDVMPYPVPGQAVTIRDNGAYCVAINFTQIPTTRRLRTVTMHEDGHIVTGALHKVDSPYQLVEQSEYKADASSFKRFLAPDILLNAMRQGYTEPWQLAEYFDLEEETIDKALYYWTECKGVEFSQKVVQ